MRPLQIHEKSKAAFGIFRSKKAVKVAKSELNAHGFSTSAITILYPPYPGAQDFQQSQKSFLGKGTLIGAAAGGLIAIAIGILMTWNRIPMEEIGATAGFPDKGFLIIMGLLSGIAFGAACGALVVIGIPERAGQRYGGYVGAGGILMSVRVDSADQENDAQDVLERSGAQDINFLKEGHGWESVYSKILQNNHTHHPVVH